MARYQPPGRRGTQPPGKLPARQLPPPDPASRQQALAAFALGMLSLLGLALGLGNVRRGVFVAILTLLFAVIAIWLGVMVNRRARRGGTARPRGAISGIVLGWFGLVLSALWLLVLAVFWTQLNTYYNCMNSANTVAAQQVCRTQLSNSIGNELSIMQNSR